VRVVSAADATSCVSDSVGEPVCDTEQDRTTLLQNRLLIEEKETNEGPRKNNIDHLEDEDIGNGEKHKKFGQDSVEGFGLQAGKSLPQIEHREEKKIGNGGQDFVEGFRSQAGSIKQGWGLPQDEHQEDAEIGNGVKQTNKIGAPDSQGWGLSHVSGSIHQGWGIGEGLGQGSGEGFPDMYEPER